LAPTFDADANISIPHLIALSRAIAIKGMSSFIPQEIEMMWTRFSIAQSIAYGIQQCRSGRVYLGSVTISIFISQVSIVVCHSPDINAGSRRGFQKHTSPMSTMTMLIAKRIERVRKAFEGYNFLFIQSSSNFRMRGIYSGVQNSDSDSFLIIFAAFVDGRMDH
jgi:hypothetical protein